MPSLQKLKIKGAIFDTVQTVARKRPVMDRFGVLPNTELSTIASFDSETMKWLAEIRLLSDSTLRPNSSITDGSSFDAFWRTLVYNRGTNNETSPNDTAATWLGNSFGYWYLLIKLRIQMQRGPDHHHMRAAEYILQELATPFEDWYESLCHERHFFVSEQGRIGWVPLRTIAGDQICTILGMRIPVVLRKVENGWELIGGCYVHGVMDGELWDFEDLEWEFLTIV